MDGNRGTEDAQLLRSRAAVWPFEQKIELDGRGIQDRWSWNVAILSRCGHGGKGIGHAADRCRDVLENEKVARARELVRSECEPSR